MPIPGQVMPDDIEVRLGRALTSSEIGRVAADIDDAYALSGLHSLMDTASPTAAQNATIARVVLRAFLNPEGRPTQQTVGGVSKTYSSTVRSGIYFTPDDVVALRGYSEPRAYSVPLRS